MEVTRYIFQSPYSNQVQIGRPDVNSSSSSTNDASTKNNPVGNVTNLDAVVEQKSKVAANPDKILDMYV